MVLVKEQTNKLMEWREPRNRPTQIGLQVKKAKSIQWKIISSDFLFHHPFLCAGKPDIHMQK